MHFITGKHLPRRTFLRGMGATVALPLLDAMIPAARPWRDTAAEAGATRLICIEEVMGSAGASPWGWEQGFFAPLTVGRDFKLGPENQIRPLEEFREYLTVVSNTDCRMAEAFVPEQIAADHQRTAAVFLTQSHPKQTLGSDIFVGRSVDQFHAQHYGQDTPLPSLELSIESAATGAGCGHGYHCSYAHSISWASSNEPLPAVRSPRLAFERMFGQGYSVQDRMERRLARRSILDWVADEVAHLHAALGASDRTALERYLEDIRELERRIELVEARNSSGEERDLPEAPAAVPDSWMEHMEIMFDLQVLGLETDTMRVTSLKTGSDLSNRVFPESGVSSGFHATSHHGNLRDVILDYHRINTYRLSAVGHLLRRLRDTTEAGVPLLDKTAIVWGSAMGDPNPHNHRRCPLILMGKANGALEGNVHLRAPDGTPMANVFVSLLRGIGHPELRSFGDSTGALPLTVVGRGQRSADTTSSSGDQ